MPELPDARRERFILKHGLSAHVAQVLIDNKELADFFESAVKLHQSPKEIANWLVTDLMSFVDERQKDQERSLLAGLKIGPEHIADLAKLVDSNTINRATAKQILGQVVRTGEMPSQVARKTQAAKIDDAGVLAKAVESVFLSEQAAVQDARRNPNAANFLLGKVMQATKGRADPKAALEMIQKKLKEG
jgi:aspartyl-tRNA(Asn)/glutamyl-tRNA(Gln) amidotransferase subunit B